LAFALLSLLPPPDSFLGLLLGSIPASSSSPKLRSALPAAFFDAALPPGKGGGGGGGGALSAAPPAPVVASPSSSSKDNLVVLSFLFFDIAKACSTPSTKFLADQPDLKARVSERVCLESTFMAEQVNDTTIT
jgi:hypothetical protein